MRQRLALSIKKFLSFDTFITTIFFYHLVMYLIQPLKCLLFLIQLSALVGRGPELPPREDNEIGDSTKVPNHRDLHLKAQMKIGRCQVNPDNTVTIVNQSSDSIAEYRRRRATSASPVL